jgi:hypothetical protein
MGGNATFTSQLSDRTGAEAEILCDFGSRYERFVCHDRGRDCTFGINYGDCDWLTETATCCFDNGGISVQAQRTNLLFPFFT